MKTFHPIGIILALSLSSCAITRAPSLRMLDERAEYDKLNEIRLSSSQEGLGRSKATVTDVYVHPHEMPSGDYFLGGWIRTVLKEPHWNKAKAIKKARSKETSSDSGTGRKRQH